MSNKKDDLKLLKDIVKLDQHALRKQMFKTLTKIYGSKNIIHTKDYLIAKGKIPIGLVAHLDTVFISPPIDIYYDQDYEVMWSPQGLGADDRAGIYGILTLLQRGYRPHIILTTNEELGGVGAKILTKTITKSPFNDLLFLIELDRKGYNDCVFYELDSPKFEDLIEKYGFISRWGTYSDICELAPTWECAAVNLSIGYLDEHTKQETLNMYWFKTTIKKVEAILKDAEKGKLKHYGYIPSRYTLDLGYERYHCCYNCFKMFSTNQLNRVLIGEDSEYIFCNKCYDDYLKGEL